MKKIVFNQRFLLLLLAAFCVLADYLLGGDGTNGMLLGFAAATVSPGVDGTGVHITGGGLDTDVSREESPDLLKDPFDSDIVKMGFSSAPINAMTRDTGARRIKALRYNFFSVDLRKIKDSVKTAFDISAISDRKNPPRQEITVENPGLFDITDQIMFKIAGYDENDNKTEHINLCARVCVVGTTSITVQFLNSSKAGFNVPVGTEIYILGHAASEVDASTVPYSVLPTPTEQYMQKFMVQSLISNAQIESDKEVSWTEQDINEILLQQFSEDVEKSYIFGVKSYTYDSVSKLFTYTTSGIIEQLVRGGGHVIDIPRSEFNDKKLVDVVGEIFVGNSGSNTRYMYMGNDFATSMFKLPDIVKYQNVNDTVRKFEFDFKRIRLMSYILLAISHPLLDKMDMGNYAIVLDRQYIQRRVFQTLNETRLKLKETGAYDGKSTVWIEWSSIVLKYPQCHALIRLTD